jgi:hypothetical protein
VAGAVYQSARLITCHLGRDREHSRASRDIMYSVVDFRKNHEGVAS